MGKREAVFGIVKISRKGSPSRENMCLYKKIAMYSFRYAVVGGWV